MKIFKVILMFGLVFITSKTVSAQQITVEAFADTIPYEQLFEKIVVPGKLGGKDVKFILDTGGKNIIFSDSSNYKDVRVLGSDGISEANSMTLSVSSGFVKQMSFGKYLNYTNTRLIVMPTSNYFKKLGVSGLLGSEAFANVALMFKPKEKIIIVYYPFRPSNIKKNQGLPMELDGSSHPIFPLTIGKNTMYVLFDTGMGGVLNFSKNDFETLKDKSPVKENIMSSGTYRIGIGGVIDNSKETLYRLVFDTVKIGNKQFTNVGTIANKSDRTIVGVDILKYGDLLIDYARSYFYYLPFDSQPVDLLEESKVWNVNILPSKDLYFKVAGIAGEPGVEIGEHVWEINGISLEGLKLDDAEIGDILNKIKEDTTSILVGETLEKARKVMIKKI